MPDKQQHIDKLFQEAAANAQVDYNPAAWEKMEALLDAEQPVAGGGSVWKGFYLISGLFLLLILTFLLLPTGTDAPRAQFGPEGTRYESGKDLATASESGTPGGNPDKTSGPTPGLSATEAAEASQDTPQEQGSTHRDSEVQPGGNTDLSAEAPEQAMAATTGEENLSAGKNASPESTQAQAGLRTGQGAPTTSTDNTVAAAESTKGDVSATDDEKSTNARLAISPSTTAGAGKTPGTAEETERLSAKARQDATAGTPVGNEPVATDNEDASTITVAGKPAATVVTTGSATGSPAKASGAGGETENKLSAKATDGPKAASISEIEGDMDGAIAGASSDKPQTPSGSPAEEGVQTSQANRIAVVVIPARGWEEFVYRWEIDNRIPAYEQHLASLEQPEEIKPDQDANKSRWLLSLQLGPVLSGINMQNTRGPDMLSGLGLEYALSPRISISSGVSRILARYGSPVEDYTIPNVPYFVEGDVAWVDGRCTMIDIPLNVKFQLLPKSDNNLFISTGISNYLMASEDYKYSFWLVNDTWTWSVQGSKDFLSIWNISAGYQKSLNEKWLLGVEPFLKVPLHGIGASDVKLLSAGTRFSLSYRIPNKK